MRGVTTILTFQEWFQNHQTDIGHWQQAMSTKKTVPRGDIQPRQKGGGEVGDKGRLLGKMYDVQTIKCFRVNGAPDHVDDTRLTRNAFWCGDGTPTPCSRSSRQPRPAPEFPEGRSPRHRIRLRQRRVETRCYDPCLTRHL